MTDEEAIAQMRARWTHPTLDPRDVEERIALRLVDRDVKPEIVIVATPPACRAFIQCGTRVLNGEARPDWRSVYVHSVRAVDAALVGLERTAAEIRRAARTSATDSEGLLR